jgi:hypothetical protein
MPLIGQLPLQGREHADYSFRRDPRCQQAFGGFQEKQILKSKPEILFFVSRRDEKAGADERADAAVRQI